MKNSASIRRLRFCALFVLAFAAFAVQAGYKMDFVWLKGTTNKDPVSYKVGEEMVFTLTPMEMEGKPAAGEFTYWWKRSGDDGIVEEGVEPFTGEPIVYKTKIDKPGFVRLQVHVRGKDGKNYRKQFSGDATTPEGKTAMNRFERQNKAIFFDGSAGAGVESLKGEPEPKDFDEFWKREFARLDLVPIKADRVEIKSPHPEFRLFAVRVDCAGLRPVTGYLTVPKAVDQGKTFPARLETLGYDGDSGRQTAPTGVRGWEIVLNINAHGLKLAEFGGTEADRKALIWEIRSHDQGYAFDPKQNADPETAYFNGMVLRVKRALQYLKTVEGWNGKDLIASGGSQGGLQTLWAAGCGEGVTRAESAIPWCCDMYTNGKLRRDPALKLASDGWYIPWTDALGYYDPVNFVKRIPASCRLDIVRAGLGDYCCPPAGVMKMWNAVTNGNARILWMQGSQHGYAPPSYEGRDTVRTTGL